MGVAKISAYSDMGGPMLVMSMDGALNFVTFIDDYYRKVWPYSIKRKDEVLSVFLLLHM